MRPQVVTPFGSRRATRGCDDYGSLCDLGSSHPSAGMGECRTDESSRSRSSGPAQSSKPNSPVAGAGAGAGAGAAVEAGAGAGVAAGATAGAALCTLARAGVADEVVAGSDSKENSDGACGFAVLTRTCRTACGRRAIWRSRRLGRASGRGCERARAVVACTARGAGATRSGTGATAVSFTEPAATAARGAGFLSGRTAAGASSCFNGGLTTQ